MSSNAAFGLDCPGIASPLHFGVDIGLERGPRRMKPEAQLGLSLRGGGAADGRI